MKKALILLLIIPVLGFAQTKKKTELPTEKSFTITGNVTGYADGTAVSFLNEQTNQPEKQTTVENGKFVVKGSLKEPGFKGLIFGDQPPLIPLFLDNSNITLAGDKNAIDQVVIKGSPSHTLYTEYSNALKPYDKKLAAGESLDENAFKEIEQISADFVKKHHESYVAPLAIIRMFQMTQNGIMADELYKLLPPPVQVSGLGQYANQQIQESKNKSHWFSHKRFFSKRYHWQTGKYYFFKG